MPKKKYAPARQLGRVEDDLWTALKSHAETQGLNFTQWAVNTLVDRMNLERKIDKREAERKKR